MHGLPYGPERWQQVSRLFDQAMELAAEQRSSFLRQAAGDDQALLAEVESLVAAAGDTRFLSEPAEPQPEAAASRLDLRPGTLLGPWRIEGLLGRGGMGEVYLAARADGRYEQRVAIKLLQAEARELDARFEAESRILARLDHPGIARLFDAGLAPDGRSYMVMEYVEGEPLVSWCQERDLDLAGRLRLFLGVCSAVAYAHANLVVHRDIKPANILVTAEGRPKLLDFGIGKLLGPEGATPTLTVGPAFTPSYAAPEQLSGQPVTTATDVYALGVLLYELLCGRRPWAGESIARVLYAQIHDQPPAPSAAAAEPSAVPPRMLRGDLDAIVGKCLRKEPEHRYETVDALARDLRRFLDGEPVAARSGAGLYVLGRLLLRHRLAATAVALVMLALGVGLAGTLWQAGAARQRAEEALLHSQRAEAARDFLIQLFAGNDPDIAQGHVPSARDLLDQGAHQVRSTFGDSPELQAEMMVLLGGLYRKIGQLDAARPLLVDGLALSEGSTDLGTWVDALHWLGQLELDLGRHEQALEALEAAEGLLAATGEVPGQKHGALLHQIVSTLDRAGRRAEAVARAEAALAGARASPTLPPRALFDYLFAAGNALLGSEDLARAEELMEELLALDVEVPPGHRLDVHQNYAAILERRGALEAALGHRRRALALAEGMYQPLHVRRAQALNNLGPTLSILGHFDEAEEVLLAAAAIYQEIGGDTPNPRVAAIHNNLGSMMIAAERYHQALPHVQRSRDLAAEIFGPHDLRYASVTANLGFLQIRLGELSAAEESLNEALAVRRQALGSEHRVSAASLGLLAELRLAQGRPREALELADEALALFRRLEWESAGSLLPVIARRAWALVQLGRFREAEAVFQEGIALGEAAGSDAGRALPQLLAHHAELLAERGGPAAEIAVSRALEAHRALFGDQHPATERLVALAEASR